jgi:hypothetical protein
MLKGIIVQVCPSLRFKVYGKQEKNNWKESYGAACTLNLFYIFLPYIISKKLLNPYRDLTAMIEVTN